ncbi:hypothetical protein D8911_14640 (plasmid) [Levilactobacillus brevis]|nr:hypothetical protein D8911_14640 [Levilactobacillus brevis]
MKWLPIIGDLFGLVEKAVPDKDKQTEMIGKLNQLQSDIYLAELNTKTHPLIDGLHKMGRQLLGYYTAGLSAYLLATQPGIDPMSLAVLAGPAGAYTIMKGRGR